MIRDGLNYKKKSETFLDKAVPKKAIVNWNHWNYISLDAQQLVLEKYHFFTSLKKMAIYEIFENLLLSTVLYCL